MYIDAHNHLYLYKENIDIALDQINRNRILTLDCAINEESYLFAKKMAEDNPLIIPCFGIHPMEAHKYRHSLERYEEYIKETPMIGEIGLDYHWVEDKTTYPLQKKVLQFFLEKAIEYNKVVNLHTKGAEEEILHYIKVYGLRSPIIHWYSGPLHIFKELLDLDCYFTISVDIGYSKRTQEIIEHLPMDRMLTETDGPTALEWVNGEYGYPDYIMNIIEKIAQIKDLEPLELKEKVWENYKRIIIQA